MSAIRIACSNSLVTKNTLEETALKVNDTFLKDFNKCLRDAEAAMYLIRTYLPKYEFSEDYNNWSPETKKLIDNTIKLADMAQGYFNGFTKERKEIK